MFRTDVDDMLKEMKISLLQQLSQLQKPETLSESELLPVEIKEAMIKAGVAYEKLDAYEVKFDEL